MMSFKRCFKLTAILSLLPLLLLSTVQAEERKKSKAEQMATAGSKDPVAELGTIGATRTAQLTEEKAIEQLKYMVVQGWKRMDPVLVSTGSFVPFGMTLMPDGEYKTVLVNPKVADGVTVTPEFTLNAIVENIRAIAETKAVWAVGLMYIQANEQEDGTYVQRIQVITEHIAGWARHWSYPFKVEDGKVKLGAPSETAVKAVYFSK